METDKPPPAVDEIATRLHAAAIHLLRTLRREDAAAGMTAPRLSVLSVLVFGGPTTLGALADAEQVRPPTMTRLIAALERDGLVERLPETTDRRVVRVRATARARRVLEDGRDRRVRRLSTMLLPLAPADRSAIVRAVDAIERALAGGSTQESRYTPALSRSTQEHDG